MKVKSKQKSVPLFLILIMLIFGVGIVAGIVQSLLAGASWTILVLLPIFLLGVFFIKYSLFSLAFLFKKPQQYEAILKNKRDKTYKGKKITEMKFKIKTSEMSAMRYMYECYVEGSCDLKVGQVCGVKIKEFTGEIKSVDEFVDTNNVSREIRELSWAKDLMAIFMSVGVTIIAIIMSIEQKSILTIGIGGFIFGAYMINLLKVYRILVPNSGKQRKITKEFDTFAVYYFDNEKVRNYSMQIYLKCLSVLLLIWLVIFFAAGLPILDFMVAFFMFGLIPIVSIIGLMIYYYNFDERYIQNNNLSIISDADSECEKHIHIVNINKILSRFMIYNCTNNQLLYKAQKVSGIIKERFVISDANDYKVGEIIRIGDSYTIRVNGESGFIIMKKSVSAVKYMENLDYVVDGRDYHIKGFQSMTRSFVLNNSNKKIVDIAIKNKYGDATVSLCDDFRDSKSLIFTAFVVALGNSKMIELESAVD